MMPIILQENDANICLPGADATRDCDALLADVAKRVIQLRRSKKSILSSELFVEPAWEMMLDLFISHSMDRTVGSTSIAIASGMPLSTGLRYLRVLELQNLVTRCPDPKDGRVYNVNLTDTALAHMRNILQMATVPLER